MNIPTVILFNKGEAVGRLEGDFTASDVEALITGKLQQPDDDLTNVGGGFAIFEPVDSKGTLQKAGQARV